MAVKKSMSDGEFSSNPNSELGNRTDPTLKHQESATKKALSSIMENSQMNFDANLNAHHMNSADLDGQQRNPAARSPADSHHGNEAFLHHKNDFQATRKPTQELGDQSLRSVHRQSIALNNKKKTSSSIAKVEVEEEQEVEKHASSNIDTRSVKQVLSEHPGSEDGAMGP